VKYNPNANMYVSASKDGSIKVWDGISNKCINTFPGAHDGTEVCSVVFSRNSKVSKRFTYLFLCLVAVTLIFATQLLPVLPFSRVFRVPAENAFERKPPSSH
jgi:hypothetical protein